MPKNFYEDALVKAYSAMFHAGRAFLFKDGFAEKSHYGLYVYLSELDSLRPERHEILYALDEPSVSKEEASDVLAVVEDFIKIIKKRFKLGAAGS